MLGTGTEDSGSYKKEVFGGHRQRKKMILPTHKFTVLTKGFKIAGRIQRLSRLGVGGVGVFACCGRWWS